MQYRACVLRVLRTDHDVVRPHGAQPVSSPGPSYLDDGSGGPDNDFTNRNTTFMTWNLMHLARLLKDNGGITAHGNQRAGWDAGCRYDFENPEHR